MKFNNDKFMRGTNYSSAYANWSKELLNVLEEAGDKYPEYENNSHKFLETVIKDGKYKRHKMFYIICPCDGSDITVKLIDNMDKEEVEMAMDFVINFVSVMIKHGYITE